MGRWIDANDHMYIENLAVDDKQCPPFRQRFFFWGGVYPLFVIRPILYPSVKIQKNILRSNVIASYLHEPIRNPYMRSMDNHTGKSSSQAAAVAAIVPPEQAVFYSRTAAASHNYVAGSPPYNYK